MNVSYDIEINNIKYNNVECIAYYDGPLDFYIEKDKIYIRWLDIMELDDKKVNLWGLVKDVSDEIAKLNYEDFIKLNLELYYTKEYLDVFFKYNKEYGF